VPERIHPDLTAGRAPAIIKKPGNRDTREH
jgi:hypothetical protein